MKDILDDSDLLDQITDLLNEDPPAPHWRHLAKELKIPQEKCKIFEPTEDSNSPTKLLFKSIENWEPDLTFEELVLALVAMKRHDVLNVLQKYFSSKLNFFTVVKHSTPVCKINLCTFSAFSRVSATCTIIHLEMRST